MLTSRCMLPWLRSAPYPALCPRKPLRPVGDMQPVSYGARSRQYSPLLPASSSQPRSIVERPRSGPMGRVHINTYTLILERSACSVKHPCALSALGLFFCDFSAARPRFVARLARSDSPQSRGPCPRADPPAPRPSRSASEEARSRLRGLPHAPQLQSCFFTTTSLLGSSYSPAVTLFFLSLLDSRPS